MSSALCGCRGAARRRLWFPQSNRPSSFSTESRVATSTPSVAESSAGAAGSGGGKLWTVQHGGGLHDEHRWEERLPSIDSKAVTIELHGKEDARLAKFEGYGVLIEDKQEDIKTLVDSFTSPALAAALRDREDTLQTAAHLLGRREMDVLKEVLRPFGADYVARSRAKRRQLDLSQGFTDAHMYTVKKHLARMPRHITKLTEHRASVMVPLCNVDGVASVLLTKRSSTMRRHKDEVCFPGGKVDVGIDQHIVHTAIREMKEETGIGSFDDVEVLGVLRCDWGEVASHTHGVAVTPVVGFLGDLAKEQLRPNPTEVSHCFTVPLRKLLDDKLWIVERYRAPVFTGGPYVIWGLTGYVLHRFVMDVIKQHFVVVNN